MNKIEFMVLAVTILSGPATMVWLYNEVVERMNEYE